MRSRTAPATLWLVACAAACASPTAPPLAGELAPATKHIARAFARYPIVALSELHGNPESQALFASLVRDPQFQAVAPEIVVEFGNALHQATADRYVAGEAVPQDALERIWRDTTQISGIFNLPMYGEMLAEVRAVNARLPAGRKLRVWLGDPPIDWRLVTSPADEDMNDWRDAHFAGVVERIRGRGRKALLFIGGAHISRAVMFPNSVIHLLDARRPGETHVASVLDIGAVTPEVASWLRAWPAGSAASVKRTRLGKVRLGDVGFRFSRGILEDDVDAIVLLSHTALRYAGPPPVDPGSAHGAELKRRQDLAAATAAFRGGAVRFEAEREALVSQARVPLEQIVTELRRDRELRLLVKAFADERELEPLSLSARRAAAVIAWLAGRGIESSRLTPMGCGSLRPLTFGATEDDRARNRRAELVRHTPAAGCEPPW